MCTLYYSKFENVISQVPTGLQIIPASFDDSETPDLGGAAYDYEPEENDILMRCCAILPCKSCAHYWKMPLPSRARA